MIPQLIYYPVPSLNPVVPDKILWCNKKGKVCDFKTQHVWKDLQVLGPKVDWHDLVWFKHRIPSHSFILWLAMLKRLSTQQRLVNWGIANVKKCVFCNTVHDSIKHLFFECRFSNKVWSFISLKANMGPVPHRWNDLVPFLQCTAKGKGLRMIIKRLSLAATVYHIWRERNSRMFNGIPRSEDKVITLIIEDIRFKIFGISNGNVGIPVDIRDCWGIPKKNSFNNS